MVKDINKILGKGKNKAKPKPKPESEPEPKEKGKEKKQSEKQKINTLQLNISKTLKSKKGQQYIIKNRNLGIDVEQNMNNIIKEVEDGTKSLNDLLNMNIKHYM